MRQMTRSGSFHGHHIRECGVWEDRVSFHDQSANHMMRQFTWSGISREIDKWQDGAISRYCRASRKCCSHICYFSKFLAELFDMFFFLATVSWLVKFLRFAISYFVHNTVCDWSKPLILKQLHLSFFNQLMLPCRMCAEETRPIIDDISRCKCQIVS